MKRLFQILTLLVIGYLLISCHWLFEFSDSTQFMIKNESSDTVWWDYNVESELGWWRRESDWVKEQFGYTGYKGFLNSLNPNDSINCYTYNKDELKKTNLIICFYKRSTLNKYDNFYELKESGDVDKKFVLSYDELRSMHYTIVIKD